jgi:hypothetical protein
MEIGKKLYGHEGYIEQFQTNSKPGEHLKCQSSNTNNDLLSDCNSLRKSTTASSLCKYLCSNKSLTTINSKIGQTEQHFSEKKAYNKKDLFKTTFKVLKADEIYEENYLFDHERDGEFNNGEKYFRSNKEKSDVINSIIKFKNRIAAKRHRDKKAIYYRKIEEENKMMKNFLSKVFYENLNAISEKEKNKNLSKLLSLSSLKVNLTNNSIKNQVEKLLPMINESKNCWLMKKKIRNSINPATTISCPLEQDNTKTTVLSNLPHNQLKDSNPVPIQTKNLKDQKDLNKQNIDEDLLAYNASTLKLNSSNTSESNSTDSCYDDVNLDFIYESVENSDNNIFLSRKRFLSEEPESTLSINSVKVLEKISSTLVEDQQLTITDNNTLYNMGMNEKYSYIIVPSPTSNNNNELNLNNSNKESEKLFKINNKEIECENVNRIKSIDNINKIKKIKNPRKNLIYVKSQISNNSMQFDTKPKIIKNTRKNGKKEENNKDHQTLKINNCNNNFTNILTGTDSYCNAITENNDKGNLNQEGFNTYKQNYNLDSNCLENGNYESNISNYYNGNNGNEILNLIYNAANLNYQTSQNCSIENMLVQSNFSSKVISENMTESIPEDIFCFDSSPNLQSNYFS